MMTSIVPFAPSHADAVVALWRALHPEQAWLDDPGQRAKIFEPSKTAERIGYVVKRGDAVIASVFGTCWRETTWPRTRFIRINARPADVAEDWLAEALESFAALDRGHPGAWHVAYPQQALAPAIAALLKATGFAEQARMMRMEWSGEAVPFVDAGPVRIERYAGGNRDIDRAIVDVHNRAYRAARLIPADLERLWAPQPGLERREFVLATEAGRLAGYAEWHVGDDGAFIYSLAAARSHWGTSVAAALGTTAMRILFDLGYRRIGARVRSNNAASMRPLLKGGWTVAGDFGSTFVRKL